jgi:hypothetical protein
MIVRKNPLIACDQTAVTVRLGAGSASSKLALSPLTSTAGWTADRECPFAVEFLFHTVEMIPQTLVVGMVNFEQFLVQSKDSLVEGC